MVTATNTQLLVPEFDLLEPRTVAEAAALLAEHGARARVLAGGTDLLVQMKTERVLPQFVVSLHRIDELRQIVESDGLVIGGAATIHAVWSHAAVRETYEALADACHAFSTMQSMYMGTIGGNICNASPAADSAPALLVLDATVQAHSASGPRTMPLSEFFAGPGETALAADELLKSISLPARPRPSGSAFAKVGRVAADISKVCAAASVVRDGDIVRECRVALGAVAPTPVRARQAEGVLTGEPFTPARLQEAVQAARDDTQPITDQRSTAEYRRHVAGVLVHDTLLTAWSRAGGEAIA